MGEHQDARRALESNAQHSADEMLVLIGTELLADDPTLSSPTRAVAEARQFIQEHADRLRVVVCASIDGSSRTETELVAAIAGALADPRTAVALAVGVYVAKRGAAAVCKDLRP